LRLLASCLLLLGGFLLLLGRLLLLLRPVMAHRTAHGGAGDGVVAGHVPGDAADRSPLQTAFRMAANGQRRQNHEADYA